MICSAFLDDIIRRLDDLLRRARLEAETLSETQLNWSPGKGGWSIGQIFDHLNVAAGMYVPIVERSVEGAQFGAKDAMVKHTMVGGFIIKAAGPSGNAPVGPGMAPGSGPYSAEIIREFISLHEKVRELAKRADGIDLTRAKVANPVFGLVKMNLADCFAILAAHGERHLGQIGELGRRADFPRN